MVVREVVNLLIKHQVKQLEGDAHWHVDRVGGVSGCLSAVDSCIVSSHGPEGGAEASENREECKQMHLGVEKQMIGGEEMNRQ